jgi:multidrug resistance efflux pump
MKRINLHLIMVLATLVSLFTFNWRYGNETFIFFGFAENKEMEIRSEHDVSIGKIYVNAGAKVRKGDLLLEMTRSGLELTQSDLNHEVAKLQSQHRIWESDLKASIGSLEAQKVARQSEIQTQIEQLESEMSINQSLVKDLESISQVKDQAGSSPYEIKIGGLKKELELTVGPLNAQIRKLKQELYATQNPLKIQIDKLREEIGFVHNESEKLTILAPNDGVVGSIFCKVGEHLPAFNTLLTFYEENPTQVKGYVLESLILNVNMGDSIIVESGVQSGSECKGKVVGMGSRIVEIPERLRKNPMFKTYGREVQIEIPSDNQFLQKEKVILKTPTKKEKVIKAFTAPKLSIAGLVKHSD